MAITANQTLSLQYVGQDKVVTVTDFAFDNSYPTGGEAVTAAQLGLSSVDFVFAPTKGGYTFEYDYTNAKILAYRQKDPAAAGGADIALPETGNTTDLSTTPGTVKVFAIGNKR